MGFAEKYPEVWAQFLKFENEYRLTALAVRKERRVQTANERKLDAMREQYRTFRLIIRSLEEEGL